MRTTIAALPSVLLLLLAVGPLNATGADAPSPERTGPPRAPADHADAVAAGAALTEFGLDLYRVVGAEQPNVVISPASIALALGLARTGASGTTAAEMDTVMHGLAADAHENWLNALDQALASRSGMFKDASGQELPVTLRMANTAFVQDGLPLEPAWTEALGARYGALPRPLDFVAAPEASRATINEWVDARTEGRIKELVAEGVVTPDTRLALVNAVYLNAPWQLPFAKERTATGAFTRSDGSTVDAPFMSQAESFAYASGDGWQAVELPYVGDSLALTLIVPDDLATFRDAFSGDRFASIVGSLAPTQVRLELPRFGIETRTDLASVLADLGMPTAFTDQADFSGITGAEALAISNVIHQADIDVDEKGTQAAAATAVMMRVTGMPAEPVLLRVDHPFLFALRDVPTGAIVFLGQVGDPTAG